MFDSSKEFIYFYLKNLLLYITKKVRFLLVFVLDVGFFFLVWYILLCI